METEEIFDGRGVGRGMYHTTKILERIEVNRREIIKLVLWQNGVSMSTFYYERVYKKENKYWMIPGGGESNLILLG